MNFVYAEFPLGANNGQNLSFKLSNTPDPTSVEMFLDGIRLKNTVDFTVSNNIVLMVDPPMPQDVLIAYYTY